VPSDAAEGELVTLLRYELRFQRPGGDGVDVCVPGSVCIRIGGVDTVAPQVQAADVLQQLAPRQDEFSCLLHAGQDQQAVALQREVIQELEQVEELDVRGYVTAQIRRLRRVADRVEEGIISTTQATLMVGETLQRSSSGDFGRLLSPPGTPPARSFSGDFGRLLSPPGTPPARSFSGGFGRLLSPAGTLPARSFPAAPWMDFDPFEPSLADLVTPPGTPPAHGPRTSPWLDFEPIALTRAVSPPVSSTLLALDDPPEQTQLAAEDPLAALRQREVAATLPSEFFCPITHEVMTDPVVAQDGHTYERKAITRWFTENQTSPKSGEVLSSTALIPNHAIRAQIMTENDRRAPSAAVDYAGVDERSCAIQ